MKNSTTKQAFQVILMFLLFFNCVIITSCNQNKNENQSISNSEDISKVENANYTKLSDDVLSDYIDLKDALTETNQAKAAAAGKNLASSLEEYNKESPTTKLSGHIISAVEHANKIADSNIEQQREEFLLLSSDITKIIDLAGTNTKVYEQFCPMYGENGGAWLSTNKEIINPFFGDEMLNCGQVKREIN